VILSISTTAGDHCIIARKFKFRHWRWNVDRWSTRVQHPFC